MIKDFLGCVISEGDRVVVSNSSNSCLETGIVTKVTEKAVHYNVSGYETLRGFRSPDRVLVLSGKYEGTKNAGSSSKN